MATTMIFVGGTRLYQRPANTNYRLDHSDPIILYKHVSCGGIIGWMSFDLHKFYSSAAFSWQFCDCCGNRLGAMVGNYVRVTLSPDLHNAILLPEPRS